MEQICEGSDLIKGDPYSEMVKALCTSDSGALFRFGTVISADPLTLNVGGLTIKTDAIYINEYLTSTAREAKVRLPESMILESEGEITFIDPLKAGDRVLCHSDGDQVFTILCKVVKA